MTGGAFALHGGGEFLPGDEPFLADWLERAGRAHPTPAADGPVRVAIVPTAAARHRPDLAGAHGRAAIERVAARLDVAVSVTIVPIVDATSAADPTLAGLLGRADAIHLPGGDPDLIPALLAGTSALAAIVEALDRGAILAGASAGAMALAAWTWTPGGIVPGLALLPGPALAIVPHADERSWTGAAARFGRALPTGVALLGLGERTGVVVPRDGSGPWPVIGEGEVRWRAADAAPDEPPLIRRHGEVLEPRSA
ncbi:MAG: Type 1 glutamine amidotransferase-like domain-containing protein [Candidatus Limnocylindria bacterium]